MSKLFMVNEFYPLNSSYVFKFKRDGSSGKNYFALASMFFREPEWMRKARGERCMY